MSKISKSLSAIIARTAEELHNKGVERAYKDYLVAAILDDDTTMAHNTLQTLMGSHQIYSLAEAIRRDVEGATIEEVVSAEQYYESLCNFLSHSIAPHRVSTIHILYAAAADSSSATSQRLHGYGINSEDILCAVARLIGSPAQRYEASQCA